MAVLSQLPDDSLQWTREGIWHVTLPRAASDTTASIHFGLFLRAPSSLLGDKNDLHVRYKIKVLLIMYTADYTLSPI